MAVETFTITNEGDLALKYQFNLVAAAFNSVTWSEDSANTYDLRDVVKVAIVEDNPSTTANELKAFDSRDDFTALSSDRWMSWNEYVSGATKTGTLEAGAYESFIVAMYWPSTANDNYYNRLARDLGSRTVTVYPAGYSTNQSELNQPDLGLARSCSSTSRPSSPPRRTPLRRTALARIMMRSRLGAAATPV